MPRVETYGQRKVTQQPIAGVKRPYFEGAAEGISQLGIVAGRLGQQWLEIREHAKAEADKTAVIKADNDLQEWTLKALNAPGGALEKHGEDAFKLPEQMDEAYNKAADEIGAKLSEGRQKTAYEQVRLQRHMSMQRSIYTHVGNELEKYKQEQSARGIELSVSTALANSSDLSVVGESLKKGEGLILDAMHGSSQEAKDAALLNFRTKVHVGVIENYLDADNEKAAKLYYEETKGQINGEAHGKIEKALEEGNLRGRAIAMSDQILADAKTKQDAQTMVEEQTANDPKLRDEVQRRVEHGLAIQDAAIREKHSNDMVTAAQAVLRTKSFDAIPPSILNTMDVGELSAMRSFAKSLKETPDGPETDLRLWYDLVQKAQTDPAGFAKMNLTPYISRLKTAKFSDLVNLQMDIRDGKVPGKKAELDSIMTNGQIMADMLPAGMDKDSDEAKVLRAKLDQMVQDYQASTKKKADNATIRGFADDLTKSVVLEPGSWWNIVPGGKPFWDVKKPIVDIRYEDIPVPDRALIEQQLRGAGITPTKDEVRRTWIDGKRIKGQVK